MSQHEVDEAIAYQERIEQQREQTERSFEEERRRYEEKRLKGRSHWAIAHKFAHGVTKARGSRIFIEENNIFSYGHHFVLATRKEEGDWGAGVKFIVNADRYSNSTSGHTNLVIHACKPNVQIPYTALDAAGLCEARWSSAGPHPALRIVAHDVDRWYAVCRTCGMDVDNEGTFHLADQSAVCPAPAGKPTWRCEHVLGGVVIELGNKHYLSAVDHNEPWRMRSYFLCELPRKVDSVADAYSSLKPEKVVAAETSGVEVRRQGDVFLIACPQSWKPRKHLGCLLRDHRLWDGTHVASRAFTSHGCLFVSGKLTHERQQHRAVYFKGRWYEAVKNNAAASWNAAGYVD
ncbi:MAG TPA: hypothetical protein VFO39_18635 [Candidatus Sulfotelmatobacter sp.]|nr:hypothetical protein [Candidatus Sulfotelmatobacter sp.]